MKRLIGVVRQVVLSAQTTDGKVNEVTKELFQVQHTLHACIHTEILTYM